MITWHESSNTLLMGKQKADAAGVFLVMSRGSTTFLNLTVQMFQKKLYKKSLCFMTPQISDYKKLCTKDNRKSIIQTALTRGEIKLYNNIKTRRALCKLGTVRALNWSALSVYINNKNCTSNDYNASAGGIVAAWVKHPTHDGHNQPHTHTHLPVNRRPKCKPLSTQHTVPAADLLPRAD